MSCGCSPSSNNPPGTTTPSSAVPSNSYGGNTTLPSSGSCATNNCPAPPESEAEDQDTVCESWVEAIRTKSIGKMLLKFGASCLYTLKSKCTGWIYYDATTESVTVDAQPPFVPSAPQTTKWGFLAKVLTRQKTLCVDGVDECAQEGRQELAAQLVEQVRCGELAVITRPKCGAVPLNDSADLDKQVGIHALDPAAYTSCASALFLVKVDNTADPDCPKWQLMTGLKLPLGDIGVATDQELATAKPVLWIRDGGTDQNPCYRLKLNDRSANNELPANASACQIPVFSGDEWQAKDLLHGYVPVTSSPQMSFTTPFGQWTKTANMAAEEEFSLPDLPTARCADGTIWADIDLWADASLGASSSDTTAGITIDGTLYLLASTTGASTRWRFVRIDVTGKTSLALRLYRTSGSGSIRGSLNVLGYHVQ